MMHYLVCAAILRSGTECTEHPDGTMTLKVSPKNIMKGKCSLAKDLITPLRETINRFSIAYIQRSALSPDTVRRIHMVTTCRGENYQFIHAFYNMKETLLAMAADGINFVVVPYDRNRIVKGPMQIFNPSEEVVDTLDKDAHVLILQVFGDINIIRTCGLFRFILASIAVNPLFEDHDPEELSEEVLQHRALGNLLVPECRIVHTYGETFGRIKIE